MTSILTNIGSMVALQTLRSINSDLQDVQQQISTGRKVADAADNAAIWAVTSIMQADVDGFTAISESLSLGKASVSVARNASEKITELLNEVKSRVVAAQESNVDVSKIQTDIAELRNQITSIVSSAQFNGLNLIDGSFTGVPNSGGNDGIDILASLNRSGQSVTAGRIAIDQQNLSLTAGTTLTVGALGAVDLTDLAAAGSTTMAVSDGTAGSGTDVIVFDPLRFLDTSGGDTATAALTEDSSGVVDTVVTGFLAGDQVSMTIGQITGRYTIREADTVESIAAGMKNALIAAGLDTDDFTLDIDTAADELRIENNTNQAVTGITVEATRGAGGLAALAGIDVTLDPVGALNDIEGLVQTAIDASAAFGSAELRIDIQTEFVQNLIDSMKSGIGALADADMEAASARLQALQVQQQLGTQALSIANSSPQTILTLFQ